MSSKSMQNIDSFFIKTIKTCKIEFNQNSEFKWHTLLNFLWYRSLEFSYIWFKNSWKVRYIFDIIIWISKRNFFVLFAQFIHFTLLFTLRFFNKYSFRGHGFENSSFSILYRTCCLSYESAWKNSTYCP